MTVFAVLLRAIGPQTHKLITMKELETACRKAGLEETRSILATGNLVIVTDKPREQVVGTVSRLMHTKGLITTVFIRSRKELAAIIEANPFPDAAAARPSQMQVNFLENKPTAKAIAELSTRARVERIAAIAGELCIDYGGRISDSKLTPAVVERIMGCAATARNWNTVLKLHAIMAEHARKF